MSVSQGNKTHPKTIDCHLLAAPQKPYNYRKLPTTLFKKCHETGALAEGEKKKKKKRKKRRDRKSEGRRAREKQEKAIEYSPGTPDRECTSVKKKKLPPLLGIRLPSFPQN